MRGKLSALGSAWTNLGITPADAGKTVRVIKSGMRTRDHPRGCGENGIQSYKLKDWKGSPPRMRGKRFCNAIKVNNRRITPADAGKTVL